MTEALRQLTRSGSGEMSLRKIAAALETGPASLYAYVADLGELEALVLDRALGGVALGKAKGSWRERLEALLESHVTVLSASPALARLAFGRVAVGPNSLRIVERMLALLDEGGASRAAAAWAVDLLGLYVTAVAAEHAGRGLDPSEVTGPVATALERASEEEFPRIRAAQAELISGTGLERFRWSVDVLLQGVASAKKPGSRRA